MKIKPFYITINGKPYKVWDDHVTYEEVCEFAGIKCPTVLRGNKFFVKEGWSVHVEKGMVGH